MATMLMRNRANNAQARVPQIKKPRSIFPINKSRKQTMKASYLIPIFYEEVLPGDTWEINMAAMIRMLPQIAPPIDNLTVSTFFFFDPHRLQWEHFSNQHGEKKNPNDTIDYLTPAIIPPVGGFKIKSLQDYLGKPTGVNIKTTALPERMYNRLYNAYFRSEMLQDSVYENDTDSDDEAENFELLKITKMHDYFTDALPSLQQGDPVQIPLGTSAPVYGVMGEKLRLRNSTDNGQNGLEPIYPELGTPSYIQLQNPGATNGDGTYYTKLVPQGTTDIMKNSSMNVISKEIAVQGNGMSSGLYTDLSQAVAADISALRLMIRTQEILEADNRNGVRYTEMLYSRYGCINPDLRLTRPQYLGGTRTPLTTTPVVQTSGTGENTNTPQGNLAGYGVTHDNGNVIRASFGEFGAIMGLMAITSTPQYQYGCHRKFTRFERFDYMYPEFTGISDQAIKNKELYAQNESVKDENGNTVNEEPWGYIGRYDEYRYFNNEICGELKHEYSQSLSIWTYAENMEELQNLNGNFIEDKTDLIVKDTMAVQNDENGDTEDQFICDIRFAGAVSRVLPSKAIPQTGGRLI